MAVGQGVRSTVAGRMDAVIDHPEIRNMTVILAVGVAR